MFTRVDKVLSATCHIEHHKVSTEILYLRVMMFVAAIFLLLPQEIYAKDWIYTLRPGDNLWDISQKYLKNVSYYSRLQKYNSVAIAKQMAPGTKLRIPLEWLKKTPSPAIVISISGSVKLKKTTSINLVDISINHNFTIGDTVLTGENGSVAIQFADGSSLVLQKQSELTFDTLSSYGPTAMVDTQVRLQQGRLETTVKPTKGAGSRYEITTPAAVAAVRGTQFRVAYEKQKKSMGSEVVEGTVGVKNVGVELAIPAGFGTVAEIGKPPLPPQKLLSAPELTLPSKIRRLPIDIKWPALIGAERYRVQLSPAEKDTVLSLDLIAPLAELKIENLVDGRYLLRVRGIDKIGLEGFNAKTEFTLETDFPVPILSQPQNNMISYGDNVSLQWKSIDSVKQYRIHLADNKDFSNLITNKMSEVGQSGVSINLKPGRYYWRIAAIDNEGFEGKYSKPYQFIVRELPIAPKVKVAVSENNPKNAFVTLHWQAVENAEKYQIQIAKDPQYSEMVIDAPVSSTEYKLPATLLPGTYYFKVKSVVDKTVQSKFSETETLIIKQQDEIWPFFLFLLPFIVLF